MSRLWLLGFENAEELEPRDWYATSTRAAGVGMIAAGLTGLFLDREPASDDEQDVRTDDENDDDTTEGTD